MKRGICLFDIGGHRRENEKNYVTDERNSEIAQASDFGKVKKDGIQETS